MDTKSKISKVIGILLSILLMLGLAANAVSTYDSISNQSNEQKGPVYNTSWFASDLSDFIFGTFYYANSENETLTPSEVFLADFLKETREFEREFHEILHAADRAGILDEFEFMNSERQNPYITSNLPSLYDDYNSVDVIMPNEQNGSPLVDSDSETDQTSSAVENHVKESSKYDDIVKDLSYEDFARAQNLLTQRNDFLHTFDSNLFYNFSNVSAAVHQPRNMFFSAANSRGEIITNDQYSVLSKMLTSKEPVAALPDDFQYLIRLKFDENGQFTITDLLTDHPDITSDVKNDFTGVFSNRCAQFSSHAYGNSTPSSPSYFNKYAVSSSGYLKNSDILPKNMSAVFAVTKTLTGADFIAQINDASMRSAMTRTVFPFVLIGTFGFAALLGLIFGLFKFWNLGRGKLLRIIPVEALIIADCLVFSAGVFFLQDFIIETLRGSIVDTLITEFAFSADLANNLVLFANFGLWLGYCTLVYVSTLSYAQIFRMGIIPYLRERSWCVRIVCYICRTISKVWQKAWNAVTCVELESSAHKTVLKIVLFNALLIFIICSLWFFGYPLLLVYSILLYVVLKKKYIQLQSQYQKIKSAVSKMSQGNLDFQMDEDAGIFEPLKEELCEVRSGFQKAVEEEVKSQNMKTELITNVSHDLKTPLTAIITYIDLLKDESITDEQRREYIDTLDKKSLRLKQLISDLFEVSKASSQNVTLDLKRIDLCALLKQVQYELSDKIDESGLDFRWNIPQEKVYVMLDGSRTCRIFENLIVNITKYSLPKTRAYIDLIPTSQNVCVTFRNISAEELPADIQDLTERFVRGDKSRNTEGNGLGLAIVKSFVELQDGTFRISTDGDLFKAEVEWTLAPAEEECVPAADTEIIPALLDGVSNSSDTNADSL